VEKYCRSRQATGGNTIRHMRFACWLPRAIDTHSKYVILFCFSITTVVTRGLRYYDICTLPVLFAFCCGMTVGVRLISVIMFNVWVGPQLDYVRGMKLSGSHLLISFVSRTTRSYNLCKFSEISFLH
jgi:hypothetical protein